LATRIIKQEIINLTIDQLAAWLESHGIKPFRAKQILKWIYLRQADSFDIMTDLGKKTRVLLANHFTISRLKQSEIETSTDGSRKYLFRLDDQQYIESVLIPEKNRYTLCISSQVGCAQGCRFCLTAKGGLIRNLTTGEIVAQVRDIKKEVETSSKRLTNIVFMGMGEPLANYNNVVKAVHIMTNNQFGLGFSNQKVTISTAGLVPKLYDLSCDTKVKLAISLNATDNPTRSKLMPINKKYPLEQLIYECRRYKLQPRSKITFEYILIKGVNDSENNAQRLAELLRPIKAKINLIPCNEHKECDFKRPEDSAVNRFREILIENNYTTIIRKSKGTDISAACGQLRVKKACKR